MTSPSYSQTVLYYNRGAGCDLRLLVSIFSLRKHYTGSITLLQEGPLRVGVEAILTHFDVRIKRIGAFDEQVLVRKASLWREMDTDLAIFLDSDTVICSPLDELFVLTREWGCLVTGFNNWTTNHRPVRKRIEEWERVAPELIDEAIAFGRAINTGVQGWTRGNAILPLYEELTRRGAKAGCSRLVLDEIAMQLLLPRHRHYLADDRWNTSGVYGDVEGASIVHYHGKKHCRPGVARCDVWKTLYFELLISFPEQAATLSDAGGDKRLRRFLADLDARRKDITIVTAVDPTYAARLKRNIKTWLALPGLRAQKFVVFVNGFRNAGERKFLEHPNVKVVRWNYPFPEANRREYMLAAFVLGVSRQIKTAYWMKLDADCRPQRLWWEWPEYSSHTIVSHRWTFTRMKQDHSMQHWFNRLDDVFSPGRPYFTKRLDAGPEKISHRPGNALKLILRFNSFCHIERTAFTERVAEHLRDSNGGRMVIPSQDTTMWYCAALWKEGVKLMDMRKWFRN